LKVAQSLDQTDEWIQQNQEKIKKLIESLERISTAQMDKRSMITESGLSSKALARQIEEDERDLKKIHPIISKENPFR
jgi:hypothetical protein